jgi:hypothetical protein
MAATKTKQGESGMTTIRIRPKYDTDPAQLKLTRLQYFLAEDRRRALWEDDARDVEAIAASLKVVSELLQLVKQGNAASWKQCKAA